MIPHQPAPARRMLPTFASRFQLLLRAAVGLSIVLAIGCTRAAGDGSVAIVDLALIGLALLCAILPDTHLGLLLVGAIGSSWVVTVDDPATPWAIGVAVSLAIFHTSTAAASVAPIGASWTGAMCRRWSIRLAVVAAASFPAWAVTAVLDRANVASSPALVAAALLLLAGAGLWARYGSLDLEPPQ